jgi:hypothetical protein
MSEALGSATKITRREDAPRCKDLRTNRFESELEEKRAELVRGLEGWVGNGLRDHLRFETETDIRIGEAEEVFPGAMREFEAQATQCVEAVVAAYQEAGWRVTVLRSHLRTPGYKKFYIEFDARQ